MKNNELREFVSIETESENNVLGKYDKWFRN